MIAVFDCGNSGIKAVLYRERERVAAFRIREDNAGPEMYFVRVLEADGFVETDINAIVICAVTETGKAKAVAIAEHFGIDPFVVIPSEMKGFRHRYRTIETLGADRACAAVAAAALYPGRNAIIADFGTALTIDAVDAEGFFLGGTISAGFALLAEAMKGKFTKLAVPGPNRTGIACGRTTRECLEAGMYLTMKGAVEKTISELEQECFGGKKALRLGCGGDSHFFNGSGIFDVFNDYLVPDGALDLFYRSGGTE
ncbi:MAG: type III pantothenate kinase [Spirochaetales bacterium]|nr:type III pantothenate kinase [Spirochaetales bacterium]